MTLEMLRIRLAPRTALAGREREWRGSFSFKVSVIVNSLITGARVTLASMTAA
jgi:hypothetical protein